MSPRSRRRSSRSRRCRDAARPGAYERVLRSGRTTSPTPRACGADASRSASRPRLRPGRGRRRPSGAARRPALACGPFSSLVGLVASPWRRRASRSERAAEQTACGALTPSAGASAVVGRRERRAPRSRTRTAARHPVTVRASGRSVASAIARERPGPRIPQEAGERGSPVPSPSPSRPPWRRHPASACGHSVGRRLRRRRPRLRPRLCPRRGRGRDEHGRNHRGERESRHRPARRTG